MGKVPAAAIEDLHPSITSIGDIDVPLVIGGDAPGAVEFRRATPGLTDLPEILTIARKDLYAMILGIHHQHPSVPIKSDI
jgi:hypothetical protein